MKKLTKKRLFEYLNEKGIYNSVDIYLIDEFMFNLGMINESKLNISKIGSVMNVSKDSKNPYYQQNPSVVIYNKSMKNLLDISRKLGLSPNDRAMLNIVSDIDDDGF